MMEKELFIRVLEAIEQIAGDDFCEDLEMEAARGELDDRDAIAQAQAKLSSIYEIAHAFNDSHSCYREHEDWRKAVSA